MKNFIEVHGYNGKGPVLVNITSISTITRAKGKDFCYLTFMDKLEQAVSVGESYDEIKAKIEEASK